MLLEFTPNKVFAVSSWSPTLLVNTEAFQTIDSGDGTANIELQFGSSSNTLKLLTTGRFQFNKNLSVVGGISGSYLVIDGNANISGALTVKNGLTSKTSISGSRLTVSGVSNLSGAVTARTNVDVRGTISGTSLVISGASNFSGAALFGRGATVKRLISGATLNISSVTNLSGAVTARSLTSMSTLSAATLVISGASSFSGSALFARNLTSKGTISGSRLIISGVTNLSGALTAIRSMTVKGALSGASLIVSGPANFSGSSTFRTTVNAKGTLSGSRLIISGVTNLSGAVTALRNLTTKGVLSGASLVVSGASSFTGTALFGNDVTVKTILSGSRLTVSGTADFGGAITALRNVTVKGIFSGASLVISGASSFSGAALFGSSVTVKGSLSGSSLFGFGLGDCSNATTSKLIYNSTTGKFSCATDQNTSGALTESGANARYLSAAGGTLTGTLTIDVTSADTVKTTTGTSDATDFSKAGSTLLNVTSHNDIVTMDVGTVPNGGLGTIATSTLTTGAGAAVGAGGMVIQRDDGQFIIIRGNNLSTAAVWDGIGNSMQNMNSATPGGSVNKGAIALKRPDGKYLIMRGGGVAVGYLFDPYDQVSTTVNIPTMTSCTAGDGTNAALLASGSYLIICGGTGNWGLYNPNPDRVTTRYNAGVALGGTFRAGSQILDRGDGTFLVLASGNTSTHWIYNSGMPANLAWSAINPITSNAPTLGTGALSIRRPDGKFLILTSGADASTIYDPKATSANPYGTFTPQSGAGFGPTASLLNGASAVWRPDGKYLLIIGNSFTSNIIDPSREDNGQFTLGPTSTFGFGTNAIPFIDGRGQVRILTGGGQNTTETYDMGFVRGGPSTSTGAIYETECITASMHSGSYMTWRTNADDLLMKFQVKTGNGSCSGSYKYVLRSGDKINPVSGDNRVQIKVTFERSSPTMAHQDWSLVRPGQTLYRPITNDPALHEVIIHNRAYLHRSQFDFGNAADSSGPVAVNIINDRDKNLQIQLANMVAYSSTMNTSNTHFYNGAFGTGASLPTSANIGTVVIRRPDGKYVVLPGTAASNQSGVAYAYDPLKQTWESMSTVPTVRTSTGAQAFKRPNGTFLIVLGGGIKTTNIYDPIANTFTAGPDMEQKISEGSQAIPLPNGRVLILHGGLQRTSTVYDPITNSTESGATTTLRIGRGSIVIPKPDGEYLLIPGTNDMKCALQTATQIFDPYANQFFPNPGVNITTGTGPGAFAFERSDGQWVIMKGGATAGSCNPINTTQIYNPYTNRMIVGPVAPNTASRHGGMAMQRPDGNWLMVYGNTATGATAIYTEKAGAFTTDAINNIGAFYNGPSSGTPIGSGSVVFQRDDGRFVIIPGGTAPATSSTTMLYYDAGWVSEGYYRSEAINIPDLSSTSTFSYEALNGYEGITVKIRTGTSALTLNKSVERELPSPGSLINPSTGETWLSANFSFRRTFPSNPGLFEDVWSNGGTKAAFRYRTIASPGVKEFSIGKDTDLVNLRADKTSLFRVNSNGDIYTGNKGSLFSGGADLAERYTSKDSLKPGDLVTFDYSDDHAVRRSSSAYQGELLGVVSTNPGFVAGAFTKDSYPIALVGRVPVSVTLENGIIKVGDRITSSPLSGYGMKATKAGRVVGLALEPSKPENFKPCAHDAKKMCGQIMTFINLSDWLGE